MYNRSNLLSGFIAIMALSSCVSGEVLESAKTSGAAKQSNREITDLALVQPAQGQTATQPTANEVPVPTKNPKDNVLATGVSSQGGNLRDVQSAQSNEKRLQDQQLAALPTSPNNTEQPVPSNQPEIQLPTAPRTTKTYLINGLLSAVPFIGYGFANLSKKMPEAKLFSYITPVESTTTMMPAIIADIEKAYAKDPNVAVNLIGISLGADMVTVIAEKLDKKNIPVNYLGIVDGTNLRPITPNVRKADNLTCSQLDCTKAKAKLAKGNVSTLFDTKIYQSSHIPLGNNDNLHARVIRQSSSY